MNNANAMEYTTWQIHNPAGTVFDNIVFLVQACNTTSFYMTGICQTVTVRNSVQLTGNKTLRRFSQFN